MEAYTNKYDTHNEKYDAAIKAMDDDDWEGCLEIVNRYMEENRTQMSPGGRHDWLILYIDASLMNNRSYEDVEPQRLEAERVWYLAAHESGVKRVNGFMMMDRKALDVLKVDKKNAAREREDFDEEEYDRNMALVEEQEERECQKLILERLEREKNIRTGPSAVNEKTEEEK